MFAGAVAVGPVASFAQIGVAVSIAPPVLPVYEQPPIPAPGYIWTPGYWAYGPYGYYWVPGTWVQPPGVGLLWTPGYWGWGGSGVPGAPVIGGRKSDFTAASTMVTAMAAMVIRAGIGTTVHYITTGQ